MKRELQRNGFFSQIFLMAIFLLASLPFFPAVARTEIRAQAKVALVYNGPGACSEHCAEAAADAARAAGLDVHFVNDANWSDDQFKDAVVWVQPGGHSLIVAKTLSAAQKQRLRDFVTAGGGYVGFCAGGFFASAHYTGSIAGGEPVELLGLIPADSDLFASSAEQAILTIDWLGQNHSFYWEGGPFFLPQTDAKIDIVATYPNQQIAALRTTFGRGRVFVTGFHPEAPQYWRDYFHLADPDGLDIDYATGMISWALPAM